MDMKYKRWIFIGVITVLLLLTAPIPTGVAMDGGTRSYTALTYKIVNWRRLLAEDGIYEKTKIYPFPMNFMSIDALWEQEAKNLQASDGIILENSDANTESYDYEVQYIRTNGDREGAQYSKAVIIRSVEELQKYYQINKDFYDLERRTDVSADSTIGFLDACDRYDEAYFENQILILVLLQEGSGSTRHLVTDLQFAKNGKLEINVKATTPEVFTCDMAVWHLFVSPSPDIKLISESNISVRTYREETLVNRPADSSGQVTEQSDGVILPDAPDHTVTTSIPAKEEIVPDDITTAVETNSGLPIETSSSPMIGKAGENKIVSYRNKTGNISVIIPKGWMYEIDASDDRTDFSINCWPNGVTDGKMKIAYLEGFGVCGTDLKQDYTYIGEYRVSKGTYGNRPVWQFIRFLDLPGNYVVSNGRIDTWWETHGKEAMQILETVRFGEGFIGKEEAIEIANPKCTINYNTKYALFNSAKQAWDISFVNNKTDDIISQSITVDIFGKVIYVESME